MAKILVLSDIHHRHEVAQKILDSVEFDKCIMLGDYFDQFSDFPADAQLTARWLKQVVLPNPKIINLIGNHDYAYFFHWNQNTRCSGYTDAKRSAIFSELTALDIFPRFKWYHFEDGILYTHAGVSNHVWKEMRMIEPEGSALMDVLDKWVNRSVMGVQSYGHAPMFGCGWDRGGAQQHGGLLWCDWDSFAPVKGVNQMVGHTPHAVPEVMVQFNRDGRIAKYNAIEWEWNREAAMKKDITSLNYALDTHSKHFAIVTDGVVEFYDSLTLLPIRGNTGYVHNLNGGPFVPERHIGWPDLGFFRITNADGSVVEKTGLEMCHEEQVIEDSSNIVMLLGNLLKAGVKVQYIRHRRNLKAPNFP